MNLRLIREPSINQTTLGVFFVDDRFFAFSLEDEIREVRDKPVAAWKVRGETAIPAGRYAVVLSHSPRFRRVLPELLDVPGFTGIRMHPLNRSAESEGCIGLGRRRGPASILDSKVAHDELEGLLSAAFARGERAFLLIENPPSWDG